MLLSIFSSSSVTSSILATIVILIILLLFSFKHYERVFMPPTVTDLIEIWTGDLQHMYSYTC